MATFYKLVNVDMTNRGFKYVKGFNVLESGAQVNADDECEGAGLYFTDLENVPYWATQMFEPDSLVFEVEIPWFHVVCPPIDWKAIRRGRPQSAKKWKTNTLTLSNGLPLTEFIDRHGLRHAFVKERGNGIKYIRDPDPALCLYAVQQCGTALQYVGAIDRQTPEICLAAVLREGMTLTYVKEQTPEICLAAVRSEGTALCYVNEQTPEICLEAVRRDGMALKYVRHSGLTPQQYSEICAVAVEQCPPAVRYVEVLCAIPESPDSRISPDLAKIIVRMNKNANK